MPTPTEDNFTFDSVNLIPTDELIEELLNRFPTVIVGYVDEDDVVRINWDGSYPAAIGLAVLLNDCISLDPEDD